MPIQLNAENDSEERVGKAFAIFGAVITVLAIVLVVAGWLTS